MDVVPTGDGDDDGVVWYRCPQCQGFLPKLKSVEDDRAMEDIESAKAAGGVAPAAAFDEDLPYDSPAEMMAAQRVAAEAARRDAPEPDDAGAVAGDDDPVGLATGGFDPDDESDDESADEADDEGDGDEEEDGSRKASAEAAEPIAEYAAQLAQALEALPADATGGRPYRPWETYEVGQCIQHLAWEDCGIVVGKETLPGGRRVIKAYFQAAGVVRLIEQAPQ